MDLLLFQAEDCWVENRLLQLIVSLEKRFFKVVDHDILYRLFMLPVLFCVVIKLSFLIYWGRILTSKHALLYDFVRRVDDLLLKHLAVIEAVDLLL